MTAEPIGGWAQGGYIPGPPTMVTSRLIAPCVCGLPTYSIDGGPAEHIITKEVQGDIRHWASRCPLLQASFAHRGPGPANLGVAR